MRIALIRPNDSGFVREDASILESLGHDVVSAGPSPFAILRAVRKSDCVVAWFAGEHAFYAIAAAGKRPSLLNVAGYEGANLVGGGFRYGLRTRRWDVRLRALWAMNHATEVWVRSPILYQEIRTIFGERVPAMTFVPTNLDPDLFRIGEKKQTVVFSCLFPQDAMYRWRKGFDVLMHAAANLPEIPFKVIGPRYGIAPPNVSFTGNLSRGEYAEFLAGAAVIVNASRHEGHVQTLSEAMLCGAIPVVSDIPSNRFSVDGLERDLYHVLPADRNHWQVASAIRLAVDGMVYGWTPDKGRRIREHMLRRFPRSLRREAFERFLARAA